MLYLLDSGYGNIHVKAAYPRIGSNKLAINYNEINITFQDPVSLANGNLYIYQMSSQGDTTRRVVGADNVVTLYVYDSTFNVPGEQYYIQMDNNFVKNSISDEAILGINSYVWTGDHYDYQFIIPAESGRLNTNKHYQLYQSHVLISLSIGQKKSGEKLSSTQLANNLDQLIRDNAST
ncbi:22586_t:CDS:2, partial [Cetraspora pellucida]